MDKYKKFPFHIFLENYILLFVCYDVINIEKIYNKTICILTVNIERFFRENIGKFYAYDFWAMLLEFYWLT